MCISAQNNSRVIIFIRPGIVLQIYPIIFLKTKPCHIITKEYIIPFIRRYVSLVVGRPYIFHTHNHKIINLILLLSDLNFLSSIKAEFH